MFQKIRIEYFNQQETEDSRKCNHLNPQNKNDEKHWWPGTKLFSSQRNYVPIIFPSAIESLLDTSRPTSFCLQCRAIEGPQDTPKTHIILTRSIKGWFQRANTLKSNETVNYALIILPSAIESLLDTSRPTSFCLQCRAIEGPQDTPKTHIILTRSIKGWF